MNLNNYLLLKEENETIVSFKKRLQSFAIANRFTRPAHATYVADRIIQLNLTDKFKSYQRKA
ncbi:hypothetical protein DYU11_07905 [Fibrisoma montanum]|uniref:Uncharacterized protein n=1 Tax=Fibrisoma montanum TaxID=2305895 RepID=A0A418MEJ2_9BACT|nr:hypothetical protein [Fibrisoma montanum]RIV25224.1 hypothetical protein DYU11_07905 [Fibrisoma montanum]